METIVKINNESISAVEFIKHLKFTNQFSDIINSFVKNKILLNYAEKNGTKVSQKEIQQAADDFRRCIGLHRSSDTQKWFDSIGINADDFENYITEHILIKKMIDAIVSQKEVESYFSLNSPAFDSVDICHIVVENENKAKEIKALLDDEPEMFDSFVKDHSLDMETRNSRGYIKGVQRGCLPDEIESKIFNASQGEIAGPFNVNGGNLYEIIKIVSKNKAGLDQETKEKISQIILNQWMEKRIKNHSIVF